MDKDEILRIAKAQCLEFVAILSPTTNSYKRLVPGFEAPVNIAYSYRNRSAVVRIPVVDSDQAKRIEYRPSDSSSNPTLRSR